MDILSPAFAVATDRALVAKGGLYDFLRMAWPIIEPTAFVPNWHLEEVCAHLEAVSKIQILNLVINQPPGTGKSTVANVVWHAWEWIQRPETRLIWASYDASLVGTRDGGKVVKLLQSDWFRARWGDLLLPGKQALSSFDTKAGGFRFATSIKGKVTGRHGDIQGVDDPIKPRDALGGATFSKAAIKEVSDWWGQTMATRKRDYRTARRVIVMQRLTSDDLAGEMLATGDYVHLRLPLEYEASDPCRTSWGGDRRTVEGELLFPERYPAKVVETLKRDLGPSGYAAQAQQRPQVSGGGIFKRSYFRFWHHIALPEPCKCDLCWAAERTLEGHTPGDLCKPLPAQGIDVQSWDLTFKGTDGTDYVAGLVVRNVGADTFAIDLLNERLSFVETRAAIRRFAAKWPRAYDKLIEDKANGPAIESDLRSEVAGIVLVNPNGGKEARANAASPVLAAGNYYVPHPSLAPWVYPYLKQLEAFPKGAHDDMVDATTQVLIRLKVHGTAFSEAMRKLRGEK